MAAGAPTNPTHLTHLLLSLFWLFHLRNFDSLRRDGLADDHVARRRARNAALDDDEVVVRIHAQHFQVANRDAAATHSTRGAHALDDARRKRRSADRTRGAVEHRAVRRRAAAEVVALHDALEALAAARADDVDALAVRE